MIADDMVLNSLGIDSVWLTLLCFDGKKWYIKWKYTNGLVQDCDNSSALAVEFI